MPARIEIVVTVVAGEAHAVSGAGRKRLAVTPADRTHRRHLIAHGLEHARPRAFRRVESRHLSKPQEKLILRFDWNKAGECMAHC